MCNKPWCTCQDGEYFNTEMDRLRDELEAVSLRFTNTVKDRDRWQEMYNAEARKHVTAVVGLRLELIAAKEANKQVMTDEWLKEHDGEWCCCTCGPSKTSRMEWCDRGCGRDYNAMIRIDHWRMVRLYKLAAPDAGKEGA
jgi:hypothetical protein